MPRGMITYKSITTHHLLTYSIIEDRNQISKRWIWTSFQTLILFRLGSRERRQLWPNIRSQISGKYTTSTFIGLHDQSEENGWEWTDGSLVIYKNWQAKQPDNWHGEEDCVRMRTGGKWDDISCSLSFKYVCKKNNGKLCPDLFFLFLISNKA